MSNTFLILKDVYGVDQRINTAQISTYYKSGHFVELTLTSGLAINVQISVEDLDKMFNECLFMVKKI